jgi:UDP-N-acetylmuramyl pentapeptide phosphotransferase/UDP-N-acetylglucosamine-1-phosphate transferase
MYLLLIGLFGCLLSYRGVALARRWALKSNLLDIPNERSSHTDSIPRGGGVAIVVVTLLGIWLYVWMNPVASFLSLGAYTVGAILIGGVSWLDDWRSQPNWLRFTVHSIGAILAIYAFGSFPTASMLKSDSSAILWLGPALTYFWIVGLTNAYNFMDGIDGIAGGQAVVAGLGWTVLGWLSGQSVIVVFGLLLAASSLGFLFHNWPPARIFMGDVGSAFLGYTFAVLPLMFSSQLVRGSGLRLILAAILPVWPFVFDSTFTILRRLGRGENVFSAHRSHVYQRLVIAGHTHGSVSLLYSGLAILGAIFAIGSILHLPNIALIAMIVLPSIWLTLWIFVTKQEQKRAQQVGAPQQTFVDSV